MINIIRVEAQPAWEKIVNLGFANYRKLTREQRVWFNLEPLTTDGLWDHYMNHGAGKNSDTIKELEYLNFNSIAMLLEEFNQKYFPSGVPIGQDAQEIQFNKFPENQLESDIDAMDDKFWELCPFLERSLMNHINQTGIDKL